MRSLTKVIDQILEVIPNSEVDVAYELLVIKSSAAYAAPEMMSIWWRETADFLNENVTDFSQDWQDRVFKIFTGKD